MKSIIIKLYMFFFHPVLFCRYTIRLGSNDFLVNGRTLKLESKYISPGKKVRFGSDLRVQSFCGKKVKIGDNVYAGNRVSILVGDEISIGNNVLIASDVCITSENHQTNPECEITYGKQPLIVKPIRIGDGCWIGEKVVILPGVSIGKKSVIGAGSIVTKDIPDYCIAVGNPAKIIKKFDFHSHNWEKV